MPRVVPTVRDWEGVAVEVIDLDISMDYPGRGISENHMYRCNNPRYGLKPEARLWRSQLSNSIVLLLLHHRIATVVSVEGTIGGRFLDKRHAPDLTNLVKLVSDSVEWGTGVNDRDHQWRTLPAEYDAAAVPEIRVGLKLGVIRRVER